MKKKTKDKTASLKKTLAKMKWWAKEKDRRYLKHKKLAEKVFGPLVKKLELDSLIIFLRDCFASLAMPKTKNADS